MRRFLFLLALLALWLPPGTGAAQTALDDAPNDPRLERQWSLGQINLQCAWGHTTGSPDVTVAVIDSGIDPNHPDLVGAIRDDGFNFVDNNDDPTDLNGHGTHVAGIIAATVNNGEGIAGVAGGGTKILPIRVMQADGQGTNNDIIAGIRYATEKQVQIINMSLGSLLPLESEDIVAAIRDAHDSGVLVIIAAGNSFVPLPNFAFGIEEIALVVAATDDEDRKTDFSNYGKWIAVSAPGDGILSTMPTYGVYLTDDLPPDQRFNKNYDALSGTSQATPIVAGVAALLFAQHPDWTAEQVRAEIQKTAADISAQNPTKKLGPVTYFEPSNLGAGRIDACKALGGPVEKAPVSTDPGSDPGTDPGSDPGNEATTPGVTASGEPLNVPLIAGIGAGVLGVAALGFVVLRRRRKPLATPAYGGPPPFQPAQSQPGHWSDPEPGRQAGAPWAAPTQASVPLPGAMPDRLQPSSPLPGPAADPVPLQGNGRAWGKLTIEQGPEQGRFFLLRESQLTLGRDPGLPIALAADASVSRTHARITRTEGGVALEDIGSSHGTRLNGRPLSGLVFLRAGDQIQVGQSTLRFEA